MRVRNNTLTSLQSSVREISEFRLCKGEHSEFFINMILEAIPCRRITFSFHSGPSRSQVGAVHMYMKETDDPISPLQNLKKSHETRLSFTVDLGTNVTIHAEDFQEYTDITTTQIFDAASYISQKKVQLFFDLIQCKINRPKHRRANDGKCSDGTVSLSLTSYE